MGQWSETDIAYFAGLLDGEGSISITKRTDGHRITPGYRPFVQIKMISEPVIRWLGATFGGNVYTIRTVSDRQIQWEWHARESALLPLLSAVRPFLRVKGPQADVVIEFARMNLPRNYRSAPPELIASREAAWNKIGHLNGDGGRVRSRVHQLTPI